MRMTYWIKRELGTKTESVGFKVGIILIDDG